MTIATRFTRLAILTLVLLTIGSLALPGTTSAQEGDGFDVDVEFPEEFVADNNQTIGVEVTNNEDSELVSPLIEIQERSDFDINSSYTSEVTVETQDGTETRNADLTDSSFRNGDALEIEGVGIPAGETYTYLVGTDVDSPGDTDVQVDVRPLNNESNNDRDTYDEEALGFGDIEVDFGSSPNDVHITGENTDISTTGSDTKEVIAERDYTVAANITILDEDLGIEGVSPELFNTESVSFSDVNAGSADDPTVVGHTESTADILNPNTRTDTGNAETATTVETTYTLEVGGASDTYLVIEDQGSLDPWTGDIEFGINDDNGTIEEIENTDGVTLVELSVDDDVDGNFEFIGYQVGDAEADGDVDSDDADKIAQAVADGSRDSINDYGDVTDSDDVSVVDAMYIQQYLDNNRDADYDLTGGN